MNEGSNERTDKLMHTYKIRLSYLLNINAACLDLFSYVIIVIIVIIIMIMIIIILL